MLKINDLERNQTLERTALQAITGGLRYPLNNIQSGDGEASDPTRKLFASPYTYPNLVGSVVNFGRWL